MIFRWLLLTSLLVGCTTVRPRVPITLPGDTWPQGTQVHWYDINGDTEAQLRAEMDARGPENDGERHDAYTAWHITWRFPFVEDAAGCSTGPVTTDVRVVITLPRWAGPSTQNATLEQRWRRYLEALREHEDGHRLAGLHAASDIIDELPQVPAQQTCQALEQLANARARAIIEAHHARELDYDAETRHGATQGALFP